MSTESTKLKDNQFIYGQEAVTITSVSGEVIGFEYMHVDSETLKVLSQDKYESILKLAKVHLEHQEEIKAQRQRVEIEARLAVNQAKHDEFVAKVETEEPRLKDIGVEYGAVSYNNAGLSINISGIRISYSSSVFKGWRSESTDKVWELEDYNYKRRRYKNLSKAVDTAVELVQAKKASEGQKLDKDTRLAEFVNTAGMVYKKGWHSTGHKYGEGHETHRLEVPADEPYTSPKAEFDLSFYNDDIIATKVTLAKANIFGREVEELSFKLILLSAEEIRAFWDEVKEEE